MDLLRRGAVARRRHVVVQPAHVDDEAHARRSRVEAARPSRAASFGDLPAAAVRADDAQPRVAASGQPSAVGYQLSNRTRFVIPTPSDKASNSARMALVLSTFETEPIKGNITVSPARWLQT